MYDDSLLSEFQNAHAIMDDILVLSKGKESEHVVIVEKILKTLDRAKYDNFGYSAGNQLAFLALETQVATIVELN